VHEFDVFKERLDDLCKDMDISIDVNGFDFEFNVFAGYDLRIMDDSFFHMTRTSGRFGRDL
jgi:hypothetical protein